MESLNPKAASFVPPSHVPVRRKSASISLHYSHSPPSPTRPGLSASIHAPFRHRKGLSASIHACSSPPEEGLHASIHAPSSPPRPDSSASIHVPCTPPKRGLNASIHAPSQHEHMEPTPIPVIDLSPERRTRRVIDPKRECDLVVLVSGGSVSPWTFLMSLSGHVLWLPCGITIGWDSFFPFRCRNWRRSGCPPSWILPARRCSTCMDLHRQRDWGVIRKGIGASRRWRVLPVLLFSSFRMGFISRGEPHPIVVLSGWSGADECRDHSAVLNARCVDRLRRLWRVHSFFYSLSEDYYTHQRYFVCCGSDHAMFARWWTTEWIKPHSRCSLHPRKPFIPSNMYRHMQPWTSPERRYISMDSCRTISLPRFVFSNYDSRMTFCLQLHLTTTFFLHA